MRLAPIALALIAGCSSCARGSPPAFPKPDESAMLELVGLLAPGDDARIAGTDGEKAAAELLAARFRALGLKAAIEEFPIAAYASKGARVELEGKTLAANALLYSPSTPGDGISAPIADGGYGYPDELGGVSGKIALVKRGKAFFREKAINAAAAGALAMIAFDPGREELQATLLGPGALPSLAIAGSAGTSIADSLARGEEPAATLFLEGRSFAASSRNLVARLPGSKAGAREVLVVGAHLDSVGTPGALDNASGLACLVELARLLAGRWSGPEVYFVCFGAEECGALGSRRFMEGWTGPRIRAMIALDTVGSGEETVIYSLRGERNLAVRAAAAAAAALGYAAREGASEASDHAPFAYQGIPALFLMREPEERYHSDLDQASAVVGPALRETVEIAAGTLVRLAGRDR